MSEECASLAPETTEAFRNFSEEVFAEGAVDEKTKHLIAVAVARVTQCPYCIRGHTRRARQEGAAREEVMEAIWGAGAMRADGAYAHAALALDAMEDSDN